MPVTHAERSCLGEQGKISCFWRKTDSAIMDVEIPCNTMVEIVLPDGTVKHVGSGKYHFE